MALRTFVRSLSLSLFMVQSAQAALKKKRTSLMRSHCLCLIFITCFTRSSKRQVYIYSKPFLQSTILELIIHVTFIDSLFRAAVYLMLSASKAQTEGYITSPRLSSPRLFSSDSVHNALICSVACQPRKKSPISHFSMHEDRYKHPALDEDSNTQKSKVVVSSK